MFFFFLTIKGSNKKIREAVNETDFLFIFYFFESTVYLGVSSASASASLEWIDIGVSLGRGAVTKAFMDSVGWRKSTSRGNIALRRRDAAKHVIVVASPPSATETRERTTAGRPFWRQAMTNCRWS